MAPRFADVLSTDGATTLHCRNSSPDIVPVSFLYADSFSIFTMMLMECYCFLQSRPPAVGTTTDKTSRQLSSCRG